MKKKTTSQLKKLLDKVFSEYIRRAYSDEYGRTKCYTCLVKKDWKEMQNGHFVSRSQLATRYSEDNCRPQCVGCNIFGNGKVSVFAEKLEAELGEGTVSRLYREANAITKDYPYASKIAHYKELLKTIHSN